MSKKVKQDKAAESDKPLTDEELQAVVGGEFIDLDPTVPGPLQDGPPPVPGDIATGLTPPEH